MTALIVANLALVILIVVLAIEFRSRSRAKPKQKIVRAQRERRQPQLEDLVHRVLGEVKQTFGEIFASHEVWRVERETRVNLRATPLWKRLSLMTRNQILRHVWSAVAAVADAVIVIVDNPPQRWSREDERGCTLTPLSEAFGGSATAPQFIKGD